MLTIPKWKSTVDLGGWHWPLIFVMQIFMYTFQSNVIEKELSYQLVGMFFKIHKELGRFCRERQYGDAFEKELKQANLEYQREYFVEVGGRLSNRVDFIVTGKVIVEFKVKPFLQNEDFFQMRRYLQTLSLPLGMVVNFRQTFLNAKRVLNPDLLQKRS